MILAKKIYPPEINEGTIFTSSYIVWTEVINKVSNLQYFID